MKYLIICMSALLLVLGCGKEEEQTSTEKQDGKPNFVLVKVGQKEKGSSLDLMDELEDEEVDSVEETAVSEDAVVLEENPSSEELQVTASVQETDEDQVVPAEEEQTAETDLVESSVAESVDDEELGIVVVESTESEEPVVSGEEAGEEQRETASVEADTAEDSTETNFEPPGAVAELTRGSLKPAACRGTLKQLKNSCDFIPEWLKDVQASNEDVTVRRSRHGVTVTWNQGTFEGGVFKGLWRNGTCKKGTMSAVIWDQGVFEEGCVWKSGLWNSGDCQAEDCSHTVKSN